MRAYLITTAALFVLITAAHIWEMVDRSRIYVGDFVVIGLSAGLAVWAWRLLRRAPASARPGP
jgi:hypothetical protein